MTTQEIETATENTNNVKEKKKRERHSEERKIQDIIRLTKSLTKQSKIVLIKQLQDTLRTEIEDELSKATLLQEEMKNMKSALFDAV